MTFQKYGQKTAQHIQAAVQNINWASKECLHLMGGTMGGQWRRQRSRGGLAGTWDKPCFLTPSFFFNPECQHWAMVALRFGSIINMFSVSASDSSLKALCYLMKGLEIARTVRMNHVGWAITRDFRFFLNLHKSNNNSFSFSVHSPFFLLFSSQIVPFLTFCQSFGSTSSASWSQASYFEEWRRSCRWSGNLRPRASQGCSPRIWGQKSYFSWDLKSEQKIDVKVPTLDGKTYRKRFSMM